MSLEITLKEKSEGPIYLQVRTQLATKIEGAEIKSGDELPSPTRLAQKLAVDEGEIKRAYFELERDGLVQIRKSTDFLGKERATYFVK